MVHRLIHRIHGLPRFAVLGHLPGHWRTVFVVLFIFVGIQKPPSFSEEVGRGGYAGSFLRMGLGARGLAMGGGSVALTDDGYVTYYNPAGLVFLPGHWFTATLNTMALDRRLIYVGYAQSIGGPEKGFLRGGFSAGWVCAGVTNIDARDLNGNDIGSLSNWEHCFFFSFALNPAPPVSIGVSGKLLYNRFPGITDDEEAISARGFGFDIGVIVRPFRFLTLGLTVKDLRSKYTWDTQELWERGTQTVDQFPRIIRGGVSASLLSNRMIVAFDLEKVEYWPWRYLVGLEAEGYRGIFLRGGIRSGEITAGAGYRYKLANKTIHLDYAYVPDPVAPRANHVFTWSFVF
jgi:hypothetical protein